ncbi:MAG TPA: response regulator transcription factor [Dehalococcoidia bacterium]|jgi:two-component system KDP operon response regulator KdpE|nr:response regulator transcription factor [Dehalococcoidia bacterium]
MTQPTGARVLVVDDEPTIRRALRRTLEGNGFQVDAVADGASALHEHSEWHPDIVLLDLGLPDMEGLEVLRQIRAVASTPILVLSVREAQRDKVTALELGADDYVTKPFSVDELLARIRVALRHAAHLAAGTSPVFRAGDLEVDLERRRVRVGGQEVHLTPTEHDLLMAFIRHPDRVLTDDMLLHEVWGPAHESEGHYLHVYMSRLRKKIEPRGRQILRTEPGIGYRLLTDEFAGKSHI